MALVGTLRSAPALASPGGPPADSTPAGENLERDTGSPAAAIRSPVAKYGSVVGEGH
jgi:hypothetical protein